MPVFRGSRYEGVNVTGILDSTGTTRSFLHNRQVFAQDEIGDDFFVHIVEEGEELDSLAFKFGGISRLWWIIADVNEILFPFEIIVGQQLVIPTQRFFQRFS